jgi:hypothetical protein
MAKARKGSVYLKRFKYNLCAFYHSDDELAKLWDEKVDRQTVEEWAAHTDHRITNLSANIVRYRKGTPQGDDDERSDRAAKEAAGQAVEVS